jgi:hypothetical protein
MLVPRIGLSFAGIGRLVSPRARLGAVLPQVRADAERARVTGEEPGMTGPALPDATAPELRAALVWNLRAALNVAALQCQFEPTLMTLGNYNAFLKDHESNCVTSPMARSRNIFHVRTRTKRPDRPNSINFLLASIRAFSTVWSAIFLPNCCLNRP